MAHTDDILQSDINELLDISENICCRQYFTFMLWKSIICWYLKGFAGGCVVPSQEEGAMLHHMHILELCATGFIFFCSQQTLLCSTHARCALSVDLSGIVKLEGRLGRPTETHTVFPRARLNHCNGLNSSWACACALVCAPKRGVCFFALISPGDMFSLPSVSNCLHLTYHFCF